MIIYEQNFFGLTDENSATNLKYIQRSSVSPSFSRWSSNSSGARVGDFTSFGAFIWAGVTGSNPIYCGWAQYSFGFINLNIVLRQNGTAHVNVIMNNNGVITIQRGLSTTLATYTIPNYTPNSWYYYEIGTVIADVSGSVEFRVNGQTVISASNVDTRNGANPWVDEIGFDVPQLTSLAYYITDWYVTDTNGSNPKTNGFLGDIRIFSTIPNASGDTLNFLPLSASNFQMVDDGNSPDNDSTFVSASISGSMDLFRTTRYTGSFTDIYGVGIKTLARKTEPGSRNIQMVIKSGSTVTYSPSQSVLDTYRYHAAVFETNPNTGLPWSSSAEINDSQIGYTII
jgi:hypothetical protein